jgi:hypothetical protein
VTELVKVVAGDRALSTEKTRRSAYGSMFVKRDAFGVGCVGVALSIGSEVGGAPISRGISGAGVVGGVVCAGCTACQADGDFVLKARVD